MGLCLLLNVLPWPTVLNQFEVIVHTIWMTLFHNSVFMLTIRYWFNSLNRPQSTSTRLYRNTLESNLFVIKRDTRFPFLFSAKPEEGQALHYISTSLRSTKEFPPILPNALLTCTCKVCVDTMTRESVLPKTSTVGGWLCAWCIQMLLSVPRDLVTVRCGHRHCYRVTPVSVLFKNCSPSSLIG